MANLISTGISEAHRKTLSEGLAHLLADTYLLYIKTQNFHWNVSGHDFYSLHKQFEEQYTELAEAADTIAERIRALGYHTPASSAAFTQLASIKEESGVPAANDMVRQLLHDHQVVIKTARALFPVADEATDEATADMITDRLAAHEKTAWMLRSYLEH